jgi:multisubunit Na+/H+ antiporter MnhG subunit
MRNEDQARATIGRVTSAAAFLAALLFAIALSAAPQLHERLHADSAAASHECAVTLFATGNCEHATAAPVLVRRIALPLENVVAFAPKFACAPRLFSILEHAPPVHS